MRLPRTESHLSALFLAMALAIASGNAWAASASCEYGRSGTGMGGTGIIARGTGIGGTGISPDAGADVMQLAGNVVFSQGKVEARLGGKTRLLAKGDAICVGETIVTAQSGAVQMRMADNAMIAVRPQTMLRIEKYAYAGAGSDNSLIALLQGTSRFITGSIGKAHPQSDVIETPTATIGVLGTDHEATVILPNDKSAYPAGTYDKVNSGVTFIRTGKGEVDIHPNEVGFAAVTGEAPGLLKDFPDFERAESSRQQEDANFKEGNEENPSGDNPKVEQTSKDVGEQVHPGNPGETHTPANEPPEIQNGVEMPDSIEIPEVPEITDKPEL